MNMHDDDEHIETRPFERPHFLSSPLELTVNPPPWPTRNKRDHTAIPHRCSAGALGPARTA